MQGKLIFTLHHTDLSVLMLFNIFTSNNSSSKPCDSEVDCFLNFFAFFFNSSLFFFDFLDLLSESSLESLLEESELDFTIFFFFNSFFFNFCCFFFFDLFSVFLSIIKI